MDWIFHFKENEPNKDIKEKKTWMKFRLKKILPHYHFEKLWESVDHTPGATISNYFFFSNETVIQCQVNICEFIFINNANFGSSHLSVNEYVRRYFLGIPNIFPISSKILLLNLCSKTSVISLIKCIDIKNIVTLFHVNWIEERSTPVTHFSGRKYLFLLPKNDILFWLSLVQRLPKDPNRRQQWIDAVYAHEPKNLIVDSFLICRSHFDKDDIVRRSANRCYLKDDAIPKHFKSEV